MDIDLKEKVKKLPSSPGVYLMKDSLNNVIYVGKSKNLKSRVGSYFINSKSHSPKILKLVQNLKDFEYKITDTEFEAFLLECELIKKIKPAYNRLMKNPKSYSYIKIILNEKYPNIEISHESNEMDGNIYFGPYSRKNIVEKGLYGIKEYCKIQCSNNQRKTSSCFNYSLGLCIGMCLDTTSREEYLNILNKIINLLNGNDKIILQEMEHIMSSASEKFDFETAAKYRDYISSVNYLLEKIKIIKFTKKNRNIALIEYLDNDIVKFFLIRGNRILFSEKYTLKNFDLETLKSILKDNILFYFNNGDVPIEIGKEEIDESQIIYTYLKNKSNSCKHIIIPEEWLSAPNNDINIHNILNKLLLSIKNDT